MSDDQEALAQFSGLTRLFPLPNLVLFPQIVQGLHIFEPRYRALTAAALADDLMLTLVLLRPGWEDEEQPAIEPVACLARILHHEHLADGRYNLRIRGLTRVHLLEEIPSDRPFRLAQAVPMPDVVPAGLQRLQTLRRDLASAVLPRFDPDAPARQQLRSLFDGDMPLGPLCDTLAYALPIPIELKQQLLAEPHVDTRAEILTYALRVTEPSVDRKFPPDFSKN